VQRRGDCEQRVHVRHAQPVVGDERGGDFAGVAREVERLELAHEAGHRLVARRGRALDQRNGLLYVALQRLFGGGRARGGERRRRRRAAQRRQPRAARQHLADARQRVGARRRHLLQRRRHFARAGFFGRQRRRRALAQHRLGLARGHRLGGSQPRKTPHVAAAGAGAPAATATAAAATAAAAAAARRTAGALRLRRGQESRRRGKRRSGARGAALLRPVHECEKPRKK
jgi:hypothetical protein